MEKQDDAALAPAALAPFVEKVSTPSKNNLISVRVDHVFGAWHNATFGYHGGRLADLRQFGGGSRLAESLVGQRRRSDALSYAGTHVVSPRAVNQLRAQISRLMPRTATDGSSVSSPVVLIALDASAARAPSTLVAGNSTSGSSSRRETRLQLQDTMTFVVGAHSVKTGGEVQWVRSEYTDLSDASGTFTFDSAAAFLANQPSRFRRGYGGVSTQRNLYSAVFAHDEWRAASRLTLSYGLRYERESIVGDRDNWAPRAGLAFDPFGSGRTAVRLGAGVFYNRALSRTIDDFTLGASRLVFDTNLVRDSTTGNLLTAAERRRFVAANLNFPATPGADSPLVARHLVREADFLRRLDPNLRVPESYQFNVGFGRELGRGFHLEANYTRHRGAHLWRELNVNAPRVPAGFADLTAYLLSRDFANFRQPRSNARPLYDAASAGDLVRFTSRPADPSRPDAIVRAADAGVSVTVVNLNSVASTSAIDIASAALRHLRPDPARGQVEQLVSAGNSFYEGLTISAQRRWQDFAAGDVGLTFRAAYTLSSLIDDGVVNTSDALKPGDFRGERARSLLDRRHRFVVSGSLRAPRLLGGWRVSPVWRWASGAPFNLSLNNADRNLDDVGNDRPIFTGDLRLLRWRRPGQLLDPALLNSLAQPTIGRGGNLPRNAGRGPALMRLDVAISREFNFGDERRRLRWRPFLEVENPMNHSVFSFGAEFVNFNAVGPNADEAARQAFLDEFLVPSRTARPRTLRLGMRFDF